MKKIVVILLSLFLITGCGSKKESNIIKDFKSDLNKIDSYIIKGEMVISSNEDKFTYDVVASNKENTFYKVNLVNKTNNHEQVILKNKEAVYVVTPSLNKSFKFQSEWPNNGSQVYLLDGLLRDLDNDSSLTLKKVNNGFVITSKVNYPNNSNLVSEDIYIDKKMKLKSVEVKDSDGNVKIKFTVKNIDYNPSFNKEYFDLDLLIDNCCDDNSSKTTTTTTTTKPSTETTTKPNGGQETTQPNQNTSENDTTTSNIMDDIIYPLYIPSDTYLSTKDTVNTSEGNRVILTFAGEKPFMLVEEMSVRNNDFEIIPVYGDPLMMADNIGALSANSLYWTSNNIDYYITSDSLNGEELLTIAESLGNSSLIVNGEK